MEETRELSFSPHLEPLVGIFRRDANGNAVPLCRRPLH